jgi:tetratricopeptide (TPR) repeat protein
VRQQRSKKDEYQKILSAYGQAVKEFRKGDFEKAAGLLQEFIDKYPAEREIVDRARAYLAMTRKPPKKDAPAPKTFEEHCRQGTAKINQGDFEGAVKVLENALELGENDGLAHYLLADACCLMGQTDASMEHLKKAIQKDKVYSILAQNEPDFEPLWEEKKFKLIARLA